MGSTRSLRVNPNPKPYRTLKGTLSPYITPLITTPEPPSNPYVLFQDIEAQSPAVITAPLRATSAETWEASNKGSFRAVGPRFLSGILYRRFVKGLGFEVYCLWLGV